MARASEGNEQLLCSFCGKSQRQVKKLIAGPGATSLAKRLSPDELKRAQNAPVWAYANIQTLSKTYGPMIQAKLQELELAQAVGADTAALVEGKT